MKHLALRMMATTMQIHQETTIIRMQMLNKNGGDYHFPANKIL